MPLITFKEVHKSFGSDHLFTDLNLKIYRKEKIGLIGPNGCGKSTLFKMLLGEQLPDSGEIIQRKGARIGYLPQESIFDGQKTVLQEMHDAISYLLNLKDKVEKAAHKLAELSGSKLDEALNEYDLLHHEFEISGGYNYESRIKTILAGVGIGPEHYETLTSQLSGGQLSRLGLAKVLLSNCDLLLLDEPTNHLDLEAIEWLEKFLRNYPGAAVIISHDRYLLDRIAVKIVELENRKANAWKGNYSTFLNQKEVSKTQRENELEKRKKVVQKEIDFIERNRNDVGMSKVARGRAKRLNRMLDDNPDFLAETTKQKSLRFSFEKSQNKSHNVLKCINLSKKYDELTLFENLEFELSSGQRLGITGPNGTGKSSFIKIALGKVKPTTGKVKFGTNLKIGYMDQHGEELNPQNTVLEEIERIRPDLLHGQIRSKLGAFLFHGEDVFKKVENLSGGEQNRLMLCRLVMTNPDVLMLDEPTNHLDIQSKEALENALAEFDGTIIAVSHDRFFINRIADKLFVVGADKLGKKSIGDYEFVTGDGPVYSHYSDLINERREKAQQQKEAKAKAQAASAPAKSKGGGRNKKRKVAPADIKHLNKYKVEQLEEMIMEIEEQLTNLREGFGQEEIYKNPDKLKQLQDQFAAKEQELELLYKAYDWKID